MNIKNIIKTLVVMLTCLVTLGVNAQKLETTCPDYIKLDTSKIVFYFESHPSLWKPAIENNAMSQVLIWDSLGNVKWYNCSGLVVDTLPDWTITFTSNNPGIKESFGRIVEIRWSEDNIVALLCPHGAKWKVLSTNNLVINNEVIYKIRYDLLGRPNPEGKIQIEVFRDGTIRKTIILKN